MKALTGMQRAKLRGMANGLDTILQVGKGNVTENLVKQADEALTARELIKLRVLETSMVTAREAAEELAEETKAQVVQVIGTRFVLFRPREKDSKITLD